MEAKRKEEVVTSSEPREESSRAALSWKAASPEGQQEGAPEEVPQSTAQSRGQDHIQAADQGDNPTTSAGDAAEVPPPYTSASSEPSSSDDVAVPSTMN